MAKDTPQNIIKLLEEKEEGSTFIYDDFLSCGSYANVRSAVARLCERNVLLRICQGVYMKPKQDVSTFRPHIYQIVKEIDRRSGGEPIPKDETKRYLDGEIQPPPQKLVFYTSSSTRRIKLPDGMIVEFRHKDSL